MPTTVALPDLAATRQLGARIAALLVPRDVVALEGELGAGKTELARAILRKVTDDPALTVPSPTFTLVETYDAVSGVSFWHFDLYRLAAPDDAWELGLEEALTDGVSLIEWPENLGRLMPSSYLAVHLDIIDGSESRIAAITGHGAWQARAAAVARQ